VRSQSGPTKDGSCPLKASIGGMLPYGTLAPLSIDALRQIGGDLLDPATDEHGSRMRSNLAVR
jgi:hypothetical protein